MWLAGCKQQHNSMLHVSGSDKGVKNTVDTVSVHHNGSSRKQHMYEVVSMRTLPVVIHYKRKKLTLNAFLDDRSSQTFVNS